MGFVVFFFLNQVLIDARLVDFVARGDLNIPLGVPEVLTPCYCTQGGRDKADPGFWAPGTSRGRL